MRSTTLTSPAARVVAAVALSLTMAGTAAAATPSAPTDGRYSSFKTKISCNGANLRSDSSQKARIIRVLPKGTRVTVNQFAYKKAEKRWYSRLSKPTRGYVAYDCANPYETNPAPKPKKP